MTPGVPPSTQPNRYSRVSGLLARTTLLDQMPTLLPPTSLPDKYATNAISTELFIAISKKLYLTSSLMKATCFLPHPAGRLEWLGQQREVLAPDQEQLAVPRRMVPLSTMGTMPAA